MGKYSKAFKKITPFKYPHVKHKRSSNPPSYTTYQEYKPFLKEEFGKKCVYCCKISPFEDKGGFHVDHYRPKSLFANLTNEYLNLFYSCAACNRFKSTYWSDIPSERLLNPCDNVMNQHVSFEKCMIAGKDSQGELFVRLLHLNDNDSVKYRGLLGAMIVKLVKGISAINASSKLILKKKEINESIDILSELTGKDVPTLKKALLINW